MKDGALAMTDAVGFKGIWNRQESSVSRSVFLISSVHLSRPMLADEALHRDAQTVRLPYPANICIVEKSLDGSRVDDTFVSESLLKSLV